jgi:hypothetical protein
MGTDSVAAMQPAIFDAIIADVRRGVPTHKAAKANGGNKTDFYGALAEDEELADRYARAKEVGLEAWADETLEIADELPPTITRTNADGEDIEVDVRLDSGFVQWQRNRIETRKWHLAKLAPKKYGDRLNVDQHVTLVEEKQITERLERGRQRLALVR